MTATIRKAFKASGQTVYAVAKATGLNEAALGRFFADKQSVRLDLADKLAAHFGLVLTKGMVTHGKSIKRRRT